MIKFSKILNEKITSNKQKKDKQVFDYSNIVNSEWNKIIKKAQDFQDIHFDLENNEELGDKRTFYIEKNLRKNQPVKYEINASLCRAGGDWEFPLLYFKIELTNNYGLTNSKYEKNPEYVWDLKSDYSGLYKNYVIIPPVEAGNKFKQKNNSGMAFTDEDDEYENLEITDKDKSNAWKWLEKYLENAVEKRHKMLDEGNKMISLKKLIESTDDLSDKEMQDVKYQAFDVYSLYGNTNKGFQELKKRLRKYDLKDSEIKQELIFAEEDN